jgi:methionyl aminopeptidase
VRDLYVTLPAPEGTVRDIYVTLSAQVECLSHELLHPYPVLYDKEGVVVAHCKATVLVMPNGIDRVSAHTVSESSERSEMRMLVRKGKS